MVITHLELKNWRNFRQAEMDLARVSYIIGPNASGKSNLLDVFRFLRDICKPDGGGLQKAVKDRGGITKLRCLHHRRDPEVKIVAHLAEGFEDEAPSWKYVLGFRPEGKGAQRILVTTEEVWHHGKQILSRPLAGELDDPLVLTQTHLEQATANRDFRELVGAFSETTYLHLVPQLLKFGEQIGGHRLEDDPFGQGFLERLSKTQKNTRDARLKRIQAALSIAVPQFKELRFEKDDMGHPHLRALYEHHRPNAGWQGEEHFSDGTLRLLGMLWSLQDGNGLLLLEEPELSLHQAVVEQIPAMVERVQRTRKTKRQILISTHSQALLNNLGIDPRGVVVLEPSREGTTVRSVDEVEALGLDAGLSVADVVLPKTRPKGIEQLGLWE
ncbi:AAA family ATPase [Billgrantia kenyensis]|uniref:AAA family ATPase n=1 Tax=Billgrantia kenyensis TaxID=321266 RepID=A0A7V9W161_9GAMM|nr:ATP-binding protein [Halomonas kenyensis]MBA2779102.1 AAA family ATPase [Halomonas kenyensis]MCG6660529.1 AAA family ATPase [Halomonas kenyensis]